MGMSWQEAAVEADRLHPLEPTPDRVPLAEARAVRLEALAAVEERRSMLEATHRLLLNRWPMDRSDWDPDRLTPLGHMSSKTLSQFPGAQKRGVLFAHSGHWQLKDPLVPFHMRTFASGLGTGMVMLAEDKRDPKSLAALHAASLAAREWVPVELVLTLRSHGLPLPE